MPPTKPLQQEPSGTPSEPPNVGTVPGRDPIFEDKAFYALALEATSDGLWAWHVPTGKAYFSPRYYTMLGYEPYAFEASYAAWSRLLHPDDSEVAQRTIQRHIDTRSQGFEVEFRLRTRTGRWLWILGRGKVVQWENDGRPVRMVGTHVNIDARKRTEQKLAEYRELLEKMVQYRTDALEQTTSLLEAVFNAIPDILGVQDAQHRIIRYNAAGYRLLGKTHEEVVGRRCFELIGRHSECENCATRHCYRTKQPAAGIRYEESLQAWLDVRAYPILDENGEVVRVIEHLRDITQEKMAEAENRQLHEQLQSAQKMEALGTLAGGIAHDFNNLLMGIQGRTSLMAMDLDPSHPHSEHLKAMEEYVRSATWLTKQLLGFARGGKYEVRPVDIGELLTSSAAMFGRTRKEIRILTDTGDEPLVVEADRGQIEQVLLNMYINAWQAMPQGGELRLSVRPVTLDPVHCRAHGMKPGRYCRVTISDTGTGMDAKTRRRIFDPFFTTKDKGRGTGLGLASAYGIVKNHGGGISVESEPGRGAVFHIDLPLSEKTLQPETQVASGPIRGAATLLLVDDEPLILDVGRGMLEKLGYRVFVADNGAEAVDVVLRQGSDIDLVILDLVMPGMDGPTAFERIRSAKPDIPVLLSSGYAMNEQVQAVMKKGCNGFLQKPFNLAELSRSIHKVLRQARPKQPPASDD